MKNALAVLNAIYENLPMILAITAAIWGIALRVKRFLRMTKEEKEAMLKEQAEKIVELVKKQLLAMVSKAESKWGGQTGKIKKSEVWEQILEKCGKLTEYIEMGLIDKQLVDDLIEEAVKEMQHIIDTNNAAKQAITGVELAVEAEAGKPAEAQEITDREE